MTAGTPTPDSLADLSRRLESVLRLGLVAEVEHANARCRVQTGRLLTDWLPWQTPRAGTTRHWSPPTVGEQVLIACPSGDPAQGIVITGLFSDAHAAPSASADDHVTVYPDGARIAYNHATGALTVTGIQTATVQAAQQCTFDTPLVVFTGDIEVSGIRFLPHIHPESIGIKTGPPE